MDSTKVNQLQLLQQNLQNILIQKQQFESQLIEVNSALVELENTDKAYKILGKIMVSTKKEDLSKDLNDKKEIYDLRIKHLIKQEESIKKNIQEVQKEVLPEAKK